MKTCSKCGIEKPHSEFPREKRAKDGLYSQCKACKGAARKEWEAKKRSEDPAWVEQRREYERGYREQNADHRKARLHEWYVARRAENLEQERLKGIVAAHRARARAAGAEGSFEVEDIVALYERYGHRCLACGADDKELTLDHVVPMELGGRNDRSNLQPLCRGCNTRKGRSTADYRPTHCRDVDPRT